MKHLLKKINMMRGGGGKKQKSQPRPADIPPSLKPPQIGDLSMAASYSYAEVFDLVSDGPIEGLVNQNGLVLSNKDILQGIYLDDTPIAVSDDSFVVFNNTAIGVTTFSPNTTMLFKFRQLFGRWANDRTYARSGNNAGFKGLTELVPAFDSTKSYSLDEAHYSERFSLIFWFDSGVVRDGRSAYLSNGDFVNYFDLALSFQSYTLPKDFRWSPINSDYIQFNRQVGGQLQIRGNRIINHYNASSTNVHEKAYINKMLRRNISDGWLTDQTNLFESWANTLRSRDVFYIVEPKSTDKIEANKSLLINNVLADYKFTIEEGNTGVNLESNSDVTVYDFLYPRININGTTTGALGGFLMIRIKAVTEFIQTTSNTATILYSVSLGGMQQAGRSQNLFFKPFAATSRVNPLSNEKFNYTNILAEYRSGEEYQNPFRFFKNILIDKNYGAELFGPFIRGVQIQRVVENASMLSKSFSNFNLLPLNFGGTALEGSTDSARTAPGNFSDWNKNQAIFDEIAIPLKHVIHNPNVSSVFITIQINSLFDTLSRTRTDVLNAPSSTLEIGSKYPSVINLEIETGLINDKGVESDAQTRRYQIRALIESPTLIDIGSPDLANFVSSSYDFIRIFAGNGISTPFLLPIVESSTGSALDSSSKRYIKITKASTETNSVLINKSISLAKVTEIIPLNFSYPYSAIVATKIDSRTFASIPTRTFDCKLKKVRIPSNYRPSLSNGKDKRYYSKVADFNSAPLSDKRVYNGDWDGTLSDDLQWTDNPAWILYDLLTSQRYGLGQYIDADNDIDIFDLYKIGRFCDAVDDEGYFVGVPDNAGGLEPRFSCNIMFNEGIKVFDALNTIAALFRGLIYYNNSQINFVDDRPKTPIALFANTNVRDGIFNYTNYRRDEQFNSIEVVYIDRLDNFLTKIEYVEDEDDIRQRGVFKKTINANGVTSRAMARRLGQHLIFQTIKENQSVSFTAGPESLLCKPGDLIIVEDELKSLKSNFGKVLSVNPVAGSIRLNEQFTDGQFNNILTVYTPTGYATSSETRELGRLNRSRLDRSRFNLTQGGMGNRYDNHTGLYRFSRYADGFDDDKIEINQTLRSQYAFYTGANDRFCYYSTQFTGWVLATGVPFTNENLYNKFIFDRDADFDIVNRSSGFFYDSNSSSGRGEMFKASVTSTDASSLFRNVNNEELLLTRGLLDSEISLTSFPQITSFTVTGVTNYEYGCEAFIEKDDINYSLIPFVAEGSLYRFQRKFADDQVYKILSIKEENPNEYFLIGTKFNQNKYELIENDKSIVVASATNSYTLNQKIGDKTYLQLRSPIIEDLITGKDLLGFYVSGRWRSINNANGYNVELYEPNGTIQAKNLIGQSSTGARFNIEGIGNYSYQVSSSGNSQSTTDSILYSDSYYSSSGLFLIYEENLSPANDRSYLASVAIL
jgi:hypothetical protein